ncbi:MAG TPA: hypothetical protein VIE43_15510 [Thermoanaerobaculia bacterium]|jgi:hypothetical protein|nr:hypothetical protein [Thermoanaerobaculia bacterium]
MNEQNERIVIESAFDVGHWHAIILFALTDFRDLTALAQDEGVVTLKDVISADSSSELLDDCLMFR